MDAAVRSKSSATIVYFFRCSNYHSWQFGFEENKKNRKNDRLLIYSKEIAFSPLFVQAVLAVHCCTSPLRNENNLN